MNRERLENLGHRLEIAMASALLREPDPDKFLSALLTVGRIQCDDKPLDPEDV